VFPHGKVSIYTMILGIATYLFSQSSTGGCYYVEVHAELSEVSGIFSIIPGRKSGFGLLSYEDQYRNTGEWTCYYYTDEMLDNFDAAFKAARAFGITANVLTGIGMILLILASCFEFSASALRGLGCMLIAASFFQCLTFLIFASDVLCDDPLNCSVYVGAGFSIAAALVAMVCSIVCFQLPPAHDPFEDPRPGIEQPAPFQPGTVTKTESTMPDGGKKITKTTVHGDGSQTVEETIIDLN